MLPNLTHSGIFISERVSPAHGQEVSGAGAGFVTQHSPCPHLWDSGVSLGAAQMIFLTVGSKSDFL